MSKAQILLTTSIVALLITGVLGSYLAHPLRRNEETIRASLLQHTPLGTSFKETRAFVERRGWQNPNHVETRGFQFQPPGKPSVTIGISSIRGELGYYFDFPFRTYVTVFWGFDETGKLMDVWVWKTTLSF